MERKLSVRVYTPVIAYINYTAKTEYRKLETNIPRKETGGFSPNFHIHVSVSDLYIYSNYRSALFCCRKIGGSIVGINKSLTDT